MSVSHAFVVVFDKAGVVIHLSYGKTPNQARQILGTLQVSAQNTPVPVVQKVPQVQPRVVNPPNGPSGVYQGQGFDACSAPSTGAMSAWLREPYRAVGIYIGGANRACGDGNLSSSGWVDNLRLPTDEAEGFSCRSNASYPARGSCRRPRDF